jgi:hypothetical protein
VRAEVQGGWGGVWRSVDVCAVEGVGLCETPRTFPSRGGIEGRSADKYERLYTRVMQEVW